MFGWLLVIILFVAFIALIMCRKEDDNSRLQVVEGLVYYNKGLCTKNFKVKRKGLNIYYNFVNGNLNDITLKTKEGARVYYYTNKWLPICYGCDNKQISPSLFTKLYNLNISKSDIMAFLGAQYPSLKALYQGHCFTLNPDVSYRGV